LPHFWHIQNFIINLDTMPLITCLIFKIFHEQLKSHEQIKDCYGTVHEHQIKHIIYRNYTRTDTQALIWYYCLLFLIFLRTKVFSQSVRKLKFFFIRHSVRWNEILHQSEYKFTRPIKTLYRPIYLFVLSLLFKSNIFWKN
jgi:hypothetical protein